jgi:type IV pilus assembly protein PilW
MNGTRFALRTGRARGFSLIEIMIALTLGLLLSYGIITLFGGTSRTNKVQDGLAKLQENGRFAVMQIEQDLRMLGGQYCSNTSGASSTGSVVPMLPARAPMVYASDLKLPDSTINSIAANGAPSAAAATTAYALSPRWFVQGYACTGTTCTPAVPSGAGQIPAAGVAAGRRVPGSDVLTIRYQRGSGWPVPVNACGIGAGAALTDGTTITLSPQIGDDPISRLTPGLAVISDCVNPSIIPISGVAGNTLTVGAAPAPHATSSGILPGATGRICAGNRMRDVRLFDFSNDFVTVSYYLAFRADDNPDARPNSTADRRLIPVLIRRENGQEQELVRGIDQLVFRYGVQDSGGNTRFLSASEIEAGIDCPPPPPGLAIEPGCMWRAVRTIEAHLLVNTVDEVFGLDNGSRTYRFNGSALVVGTDDLVLASGLKAGSMMRREFVAYVSGRNHNL